MRKMIVLAGAAMLAACGQSNDAEAPVGSTGATAANTTSQGAAQAGAAAGASAANAGTYQITASDGQVYTQQLAADGTFTTTTSGSQTQAGAWRAAGNQLCFTPQGSTESCYTGSQPAADGTFTMTGPGMFNGATVRKTAAAM